MTLPSNRSRILQIVCDAAKDLDEPMAIVEAIRRCLRLPKMVPDVILTSLEVTRAHFLHWDPQVFMPGTIWSSVSFPPGRDVTDSDIYLFVAALFLVDNQMRDGEPRVWRELVAAWDAQFGFAPGENRANVSERRYGPLNHSAPRSIGLWKEAPLDFAISGENDLLAREEEYWLKDCLYKYQPIHSLRKLHKVRDEMTLEGPRWWRCLQTGNITWMPRHFWGANGHHAGQRMRMRL